MRERDGEAKGQKKTQTWTPNTYAVAQTTLKITIGCLCRGPSRRFQGACRFQHPQKKNLLNGWTLLVPVSRRVARDQKKRVHVETLAIRENAVTQEYRLNASVYRVRPCQPPSEQHLNLIAASLSDQWAPVDGHCSSNTSHSISSSSSWESGAVDVTRDMGWMLPRP